MTAEQHRQKTYLAKGSPNPNTPPINFCAYTITSFAFVCKQLNDKAFYSPDRTASQHFITLINKYAKLIPVLTVIKDKHPLSFTGSGGNRYATPESAYINAPIKNRTSLFKF
jgi:hypothetical protein